MQSPSSNPSHQVLARKWRPRDFDALVGQDTVVRALRYALDNQRLHHAYLLTGTRGVGKTTIARILAKALNCETAGVSSRPCGTCSACVGVDQGRFPDYVEMDAASNRKVEEMTVVLENAIYAPSIGRFKVFVIDEVHMLSNHAFNAMLKTLEEPPPHVVFVLATTDPQKVPVTVLSRCMQFGLRNMSADAIAGHLARMLEVEQVTAEPAALALIGRAAGGSMRDAQSLLDQAIALGAGEVDAATVREMLGAVDDAVVPQVLGLLADGDAAAVVALADAMAVENAPFGDVLLGLARELQRIAVTQATGSDAAAAHPLAARLAAADVQVWYQVAIHGARDLPLAPDPLTGFTMTLLRMLAFRADAAALAAEAAPAAAGTVAARSSAAGGPAASNGPRATGSAAPAGSARAAAAAVARELGAARREPPARADAPAAARSRADAGTAGAAAGGVAAGGAAAGGGVTGGASGAAASGSAAGNGAADRAAARSGNDPAAAAPLDFDGNWPDLAARLTAAGGAREFLRQSELVGVDGHRFRLKVPIRPLLEPALVGRVTDLLSHWFGTPIKLDVELGETGDETAAAKANEVRRQREAEAADAIRGDPFVRELIDGFGATIMPDSIKPLPGS